MTGTLGTGLALTAYAFLEPYRFRLVTRDLAVPAHVAGLDVLHVSDTHLGPRHRARIGWLRDLPDRLGLVPDLLIATGDLIQGDAGIEVAVELLSGLEARLGRFYVLGSHDLYQSQFQNYAKYWTGRRRPAAAPTDSARLEEGLQSKGWKSLVNRTEFVEGPGGRIRVAGVDDPYLKRHSTGHIGRTDADACAIGIMHSPEVVSEFALAGFDLVLAGHTHGGQARLPLAGAVVTNSSLPASLAGGAHRVGNAWLHVSPGLGHGKFSPIRFNCPPEATLLRLIPGDR